MIAGGGVIAVIVVVGREDGAVPIGQLSVEAFEHTLRGTLKEVMVSAPAGRSERGESLPEVAVAGPPSVVPSAFGPLSEAGSMTGGTVSSSATLGEPIASGSRPGPSSSVTEAGVQTVSAIKSKREKKPGNYTSRP